MNVFKRSWNWVVSFFQSDAGKRLIKLAKEILEAILRTQGPLLQQIALEEVRRAGMTTLSNKEKFNMAYDNIKSRIRDASISENSINLAIELAVAAYKQG